MFNKRDAPEGYEAIEAVDMDNDEHSICWVCDYRDSRKCHKAKCLPDERDDNCNVYFKKLGETDED